MFELKECKSAEIMKYKIFVYNIYYPRSHIILYKSKYGIHSLIHTNKTMLDYDPNFISNPRVK